MKISVVIRTYNEERYIGELLDGVSNQIIQNDVEIVVIDSGSTDRTLEIASSKGAAITHIEKERFSFGRSLNEGSDYSSGDLLVYVSGHCVPKNNQWLAELIKPLQSGRADYVYGRQEGRDSTKFSEYQIFNKYFPDSVKTTNPSFFANNANAAVSRKVWKKYKFNELITGLEDMELAQRLIKDGGRVEYRPNASVYHIHDEHWRQTWRRYEREACAFQRFAPEIHLTQGSALKYFLLAVYNDFRLALENKCFLQEFCSILIFRFAQYSGGYFGGRRSRLLSSKQRTRYYYPRG